MTFRLRRVKRGGGFWPTHICTCAERCLQETAWGLPAMLALLTIGENMGIPGSSLFLLIPCLTKCPMHTAGHEDLFIIMATPQTYRDLSSTQQLLSTWTRRRQAGRQVPSQSLSEADSNNTQPLAGQALFSSWWNSWHFSSLPMLVLGRRLVFLGSQGPPPQHQQSGNQAAGSGCQVAAPMLQDCSLDSAKARHEGKHSVSFLSSLPNPARIPV